MSGTYGHRPGTNVIIVGHNGWWATWHGGEYIEVFHDRSEAKKDARGETATAVAVINTTGDTIGTTPELRREYVLGELRTWVAQDAADYIANGY